MSDCIFCKIVNGEIPCEAVWDDEDVLAFRDLNPQAPLHILVIPKKHISSVADSSDKDEGLLGRLLLAASQIADKEETGAQFRLVVNTGREAGQSVFHLHIHLLAGRAFGWPPG